MRPYTSMPVVTDRLHAEGLIVHRLADEGFRLRCEWLLSSRTIDARDTNRDNFGFVPYRDLVAAANGDDLSLKFRLGSGREIRR